jgi:hypothetical protein
MGFDREVEKVATDPQVRRLAERRAGSHELAEDALQETYWTVARVKNPESIVDLRAFFCRSLINEINRQRARSVPILVEDIGTIAELRQGRGSSPGGSPQVSVEDEVNRRILAERMLGQLDRDHDRLMVSIPARSDDHGRYRFAIVRAAREILCLLLQGPVTSADWNAVLKAEYPPLCESSLADDAVHQRLSRARCDVQSLLQRLVSRDELAP